MSTDLRSFNGLNVLFINGTVNDDVIELVSPTPTSTQVFVNGVREFDRSTPIDQIVINSGNGSALSPDHDQVFIRGVQSNVTRQAIVINAEEVTLGQPDVNNKFSLAKILSPVSVALPADGTLSVRSDADPTAKTVNVKSDRVEGLAPVTVFYGLTPGVRTRLSLTTGDGDDTVNVLSTPPAGAFGVTISTHGGNDTFNVEENEAILRLNGGAGDDTFNMAPTSQNMERLFHPVLIQGGTGSNSLVANDQNRFSLRYDATLADETIGSSIRISSLLGLEAGIENTTIQYDDVQSVRFLPSPFTSLVHVLSTAPGVNTVIDTSGPTEVDVGSPTVEGLASLSPIQGPVTIHRADVGGRIVLNDSAQITSQNYSIQYDSAHLLGSVDRDGMATVSFDDNTAEVRLVAGSANDGFFVQALRGGNGTYVLDGGRGGNQLVGPGTNNFWDVTGFDSGRLDGRVSFQNVGGLQGSVKDDHFRLADNAGVSGFINGQPVLLGQPILDAGFDTIDYSLYQTGVGVNLAEQRGRSVAFGTPGRLTGIDAIFGSQADDVLTGDLGANVILGLGGNDTIVGGGGKDILIGGLGADTLSNDNSETIFVAGNTADGSISFGPVLSITTPTAMKALRAEWTRTDLSFLERKAHVIGGGGLNGPFALNPATIHNDNATDIIRSGTALDLIFIHSDDLLSANPLPTAQEVVNL
jgi:Ca2+-binding RTX toxin-like protein